MDNAEQKFEKAFEFSNLGILLLEQGEVVEAIKVLKKIKRQDNVEAYAIAQANLGVAVRKQGRFEEAIKILRNINYDDSIEAYARAQVNLGFILWEIGRIKEAMEVFTNIKYEDSKEAYASAQVNIGFVLVHENRIREAINVFLGIKQEDSIEAYSTAQVNLSTVFERLGKYEEAIAACYNVKRKDSPEQYGKAQVNLGILLEKQGRIEEAITVFRNVRQNDNTEAYAIAQISLGNTLKRQNKVKEAITAFRNVRREYCTEQYARAQFYLGVTLLNQSKFNEGAAAFNKIMLIDSVEFYTKAQVYLKILNVKSKNIRIYLFSLYIHINNILNVLRVNNSSERYIAHYTRPSTLYKLLPNEFSENRGVLSRFRLSSINGVNDPTEGKILWQYLGINEFKEDTNIAFISCFTFNHDSLNQFRLYGKENNKEVTGVSVVFDGSQFFEQHLEKSIALDHSSKLVEMFQDSFAKERLLVDKLPLYRCIYIDPESAYISLARREDITFYREKATNQKDLKKYNKQLSESNKEVTNLLKEIKSCIDIVLSKKANKLNRNELLEVISEIILPLRYLVKHVAFKEEQECRMVYISPLDNPKIILDTEYNQTYVEYAVPVKENIYRVYLSQGANIYKESFRILLGENKVKSSLNPFRNKD